MDILFTNRSKLIDSVLNEGVTHTAIKVGRWVYHSNLKNGLHREPYETFNRDNPIKYKLRVPKGDRAKLAEYLANNQGTAYDWKAAIFLGVVFKLRSWGIPTPKVNLWQTTGMFICTEFVSDYLDGEEDSMITPYGLYVKLKESGIR